MESNFSSVHKILCVGDIHLSDKPPTNCTETYNDDLFAMLQEIVKLAYDREIDAVVLSGDIFHIKRPDRTSHRTVQHMIDVVQAFHCPVYGVVGNHDIQHDRLSSVFETQPFGVLLMSGMRMLHGWAGDFPIYGVPWQQDWQDAEAAFQDWDPAVWHDGGPNANALIVAHAPLYPPGQENPFENIPASTVARWAGNSGYLYYGHVHDYHGVFESDGVVFCNQGSISRGSLHESDLTRKPAVAIWHSNRSGLGAFERVELKSAKPADQVFRIQKAMERVDYRDRMEEFLSALSESTVDATSVESVIAYVQGLGLSSGEQRMAVEILEMAASGELKA